MHPQIIQTQHRSGEPRYPMAMENNTMITAIVIRENNMEKGRCLMHTFLYQLILRSRSLSIIMPDHPVFTYRALANTDKQVRLKTATNSQLMIDSMRPLRTVSY